MLQRTDDVSQVKHHEDAKPIVDQQNIQTTVSQKADAMTHQVVNPDNSGGADTHADAREEGKGIYFDSRNQKGKKKDDKKTEGRVVKKMPASVFDIKI